MIIRAIDTRDGLFAEMCEEPHGLFVSLDDLLGYLNQLSVNLADQRGIEDASPATVIATLSQELANNFGVEWA